MFATFAIFREHCSGFKFKDVDWRPLFKHGGSKFALTALREDS